MADADLYEQLVDAANAVYGAHPRSRALHAKGTWCRGTFTAAPEAASYTRAVHLQGAEVPALIRFSNGSGDPDSHDATRDPRGMAAKFELAGEEATDLLATTTPTFISRDAEGFLEILRLRRPDPETGQPNMEKLGAYLAEHPEAQTAIQAVLGTEPPASFAQLTYYNPHTFFLVNAQGVKTPVRWRWRPVAAEATIPDDEASARDRDYLQQELTERLGNGPAEFELRLQIATGGDPIEDPTQPWPDDREQVAVGRLAIREVIDDPEVGGDVVVFDPMRLIDGIEPSEDPVLHARPRAYSVSIERRSQPRA